MWERPGKVVESSQKAQKVERYVIPARRSGCDTHQSAYLGLKAQQDDETQLQRPSLDLNATFTAGQDVDIGEELKSPTPAHGQSPEAHVGEDSVPVAEQVEDLENLQLESAPLDSKRISEFGSDIHQEEEAETLLPTHEPPSGTDADEHIWQIFADSATPRRSRAQSTGGIQQIMSQARGISDPGPEKSIFETTDGELIPMLPRHCRFRPA